MLKAILFDLDDTLLGNDMDRFLPTYFGLLSQYASSLIEQEKFVRILVGSVQAAIANQDPTLTNRQVFWQTFQSLTGLEQAAAEPFFDRFYREQFSSLQKVSQVVPQAAALMQYCFAQSYQVVIATNPVFPQKAIEERLRWAGVPTTEFAYALVTTYEEMHATKPHPAYYEEILAKIGCEPAAALMVGNDWKNDIAPASQVGLSTFWITTPGTTLPDETAVTACGSLADLHQQLRAGWLA